METIQGKYKNGRIKLSRKPRVRREVDVTVTFHDPPKKSRWNGLTHEEMKALIGIAELGGDALLDTERLYE
jgi:hypothetical protein